MSLTFEARLAHNSGSAAEQVGGFNSVAGLYKAIAGKFNLKASEIMFCTVNTPDIDMTRLLRPSIEEGDVLFAHCKGAKKSITVEQWGRVGVQLAHNAAGVCYVRKLFQGCILTKCTPKVAVGDMWVSINGEDVSSLSHSEVVRILKEIPLGTRVNLELVSPKRKSRVQKPHISGNTIADQLPSLDLGHLEPKDAVIALQNWLSHATAVRNDALSQIEFQRSQANRQFSDDVRRAGFYRGRAIEKAQREFDAKVAAATAQHDAAVIEAATRKDKHFKRYDDSALAETDDRIAQAQKQLEEAERVASILPVRPVEHYCSITADVMRDPVMTLCGHTFDRSAVERWLGKNKTCPFCSSACDGTLIPNIAVKNMISDWSEGTISNTNRNSTRRS